jgi:1-acyl-sn-glycerol-3-phosphate acyltransferase
LAWTVIVLATVLFGVPSIVLSLLLPGTGIYMLFARGWARLLLSATGVPVGVRGLRNLRAGESRVFFANHESFYDILVLLAFLPGRLLFLAKKSLFYIPVFGWAMAAAGFIPIDRENRKRAAASLDRAAVRLRKGTSAIIFPEQTRTRTGELLPFKKGGVLLALKTKLPIVPVGIAGTFPIMQKGSFFLTPGPAAIAVGSPIETAGRSLSDRDQILETSRQAILQLREEARASLVNAR